MRRQGRFYFFTSKVIFTKNGLMTVFIIIHEIAIISNFHTGSLTRSVFICLLIYLYVSYDNTKIFGLVQFDERYELWRRAIQLWWIQHNFLELIFWFAIFKIKLFRWSPGLNSKPANLYNGLFGNARVASIMAISEKKQLHVKDVI